MHHPRRRNVTTSMVELQKGHIRTNLTQNGKPQRSSWGTQKQKKKKKKKKEEEEEREEEEEEEEEARSADLVTETNERVKKVKN